MFELMFRDEEQVDLKRYIRAFVSRWESFDWLLIYSNHFRICVCHVIQHFQRFHVVLWSKSTRLRLLRGQRAIRNIRQNCVNTTSKQAYANSMVIVHLHMVLKIYEMRIISQFYVVYFIWRTIVHMVNFIFNKRKNWNSFCFPLIRSRLCVYSWWISSFIDYCQAGLYLRTTIYSTERWSSYNWRTRRSSTFATFKFRLRICWWTIINLDMNKQLKAAATVVSIAQFLQVNGIEFSRLIIILLFSFLFFLLCVCVCVCVHLGWISY